MDLKCRTIGSVHDDVTVVKVVLVATSDSEWGRRRICPSLPFEWREFRSTGRRAGGLRRVRVDGRVIVFSSALQRLVAVSTCLECVEHIVELPCGVVRPSCDCNKEQSLASGDVWPSSRHCLGMYMGDRLMSGLNYSYSTSTDLTYHTEDTSWYAYSGTQMKL